MIKFVKLFSIVLSISFIIVSLVYVPILLNKNVYHNIVTDQIKNNLGLPISSSHSKFQFFPEIGINFYNVHLKLEKKKKSDEIFFNKIFIGISFNSLTNNQIDVNSIEIFDVKLQIENLQKFMENIHKIKTSYSTPSYFHVKLSKIVLQNVLLLIQNKNFPISSIYIWKSNINYHKKSKQLDISYIGKVNEQSITLYTNIFLEKFNNVNPNLNDLNFNTRVVLNGFNFFILNSYLDKKIFPNIQSGLLTGNFLISKNIQDEIIASLNLELINLKLKNNGQYNKIFLNSKLIWKMSKKNIQIKDLKMNWVGHLDLIANIDLDYDKNRIQIISKSDTVNFNSFLNFLEIFKNKNSNSFSKINFQTQTKKMIFYGHNINNLKLNGSYQNPTLFISEISFNAYDGLIQGEIIEEFLENRTISIKGQASNLSTTKLIAHYQKNKLFSGKVNSKFEFKSKYNNENDFFTFLNGSGKLEINEGELIEYANFIAPIAYLGKFFNVKAKGKSTEFNYMKTNFLIKNQKIFFKEVDINGVGFDANGRGVIGFDKTIDMVVRVSMSSKVFGSILKIPVIYKGSLGIQFPFIDPIWLGSVIAGGAAGSALFGIVPFLGATIGAATGAFLSDFLRDGWDYLRDESIEPEIKKKKAKK